MGPGKLHIRADCVTLEVPEVKREITLVWRSAQVAWDGSTREIVFDNRQHGKVRLSDGETIIVRGTSTTNPNAAWLAVPAAACPSVMFNVHSVSR